MLRNCLLSLCLAALTLSVYSRTLTHDFVLWDDDVNIYANAHLTRAGGIDRFWSHPYTGLYIPVTYSAWSLIARISEKVPGGALAAGAILSPTLFHAANIALHTLCVLLLFALIRRLLPRGNAIPAAIGAALFAMHPLQVETVAWATGMKDLLSAALALAATILYVGPRPPETTEEIPPSRRALTTLRYLASLLVFFFALLAKPSIVTLPALLLILDIGFLRTPLRVSLRQLAPFVFASLAVVWTTMKIQYAPILAFPPPEVALLDRPLLALDTIVFYLIKFLFPFGLGVDYGRTPLAAFALNERFPLCVPILLLVILLLRSGENRRPYLAAAALGVAALAPVLGLVPFAFQGISTVADRYVYLPLIGIALTVALFLSHHRNPWLRTSVAALAILCAFASQAQLAHWKNTTTLFTRALELNPKSVVAHYNLGLIASHRGRLDQAIDHYRSAIAFDPSFSRAYNNLGHLLNQQGAYLEASTALSTGVTLDPANPIPHCNLATSLSGLGRFEEAAIHFRQAVELSPDDPKIMTDLATTLANAGNFQRSLAWFRNAIDTDPHLSPAHTGLGKIYLHLQRPAEAEAAFKNALRLARDTPDYPPDQLNSLRAAHAQARATLNREP